MYEREKEKKNKK